MFLHRAAPRWLPVPLTVVVCPNSFLLCVGLCGHVLKAEGVGARVQIEGGLLGSHSGHGRHVTDSEEDDISTTSDTSSTEADTQVVHMVAARGQQWSGMGSHG